MTIRKTFEHVNGSVNEPLTGFYTSDFFDPNKNVSIYQCISFNVI